MQIYYMLLVTSLLHNLAYLLLCSSTLLLTTYSIPNQKNRRKKCYNARLSNAWSVPALSATTVSMLPDAITVSAAVVKPGVLAVLMMNTGLFFRGHNQS
jgi:hypothetical protein